jgi:hypothetical protein
MTAFIVVALGLPTLPIGYMALTGPLWLLPAFGRASSPSDIAPELGILSLCVLAMFGVAIYWSASFKVVMRRPPHRLYTSAIAIIGLFVGPLAWLIPQSKGDLGLSLLIVMPALGLLGLTYGSYQRGGASSRAA